jgi:hypothetical protein
LAACTSAADAAKLAMPGPLSVLVAASQLNSTGAGIAARAADMIRLCSWTRAPTSLVCCAVSVTHRASFRIAARAASAETPVQPASVAVLPLSMASADSPSPVPNCSQCQPISPVLPGSLFWCTASYSSRWDRAAQFCSVVSTRSSEVTESCPGR